MRRGLRPGPSSRNHRSYADVGRAPGNHPYATWQAHDELAVGRGAIAAEANVGAEAFRHRDPSGDDPHVDFGGTGNGRDPSVNKCKNRDALLA